jgi:hypothetical protein
MTRDYSSNLHAHIIIERNEVCRFRELLDRLRLQPLT